MAFKGDILEALQSIKCAIRHDLLFQEPALLSILELEEHDEKLTGMAGGDSRNGSRDPEEESDVEGFSWDELLIEDEDQETMDWSE